jgi:hypothetical protein
MHKYDRELWRDQLGLQMFIKITVDRELWRDQLGLQMFIKITVEVCANLH